MIQTLGSVVDSFANKFLILIMLLPALAHSQQDPNKYVYEPERLETLKDTMNIKGTVTYVFNELDGDYHIRVKMDSDYVKLSKKNFTRQDSCIIVEIVCGHQAIFPFSCKCQGYNNKVAVPLVGEKVKITGRLVYDKRHKWTEIHPVYEMNENKVVPMELVRLKNETPAVPKKL